MVYVCIWCMVHVYGVWLWCMYNQRFFFQCALLCIYQHWTSAQSQSSLRQFCHIFLSLSFNIFLASFVVSKYFFAQICAQRTPLKTRFFPGYWPFKTTVWPLFISHSSIHLKIFPFKLGALSFSSNLFLGTLPWRNLKI